jgi:hypothetical protein
VTVPPSRKSSRKNGMNVRSPVGRNAHERVARFNAMTIRIIRNEAIPLCGSYEVRFADGRPSRYFYWDDMTGGRLRPEMLTSEQALEQAKAFAWGERGTGE